MVTHKKKDASPSKRKEKSSTSQAQKERVVKARKGQKTSPIGRSTKESTKKDK